MGSGITSWHENRCLGMNECLDDCADSQLPNCKVFSHTSVWVIENGNASDFFFSPPLAFSDVMMETDVSIKKC